MAASTLNAAASAPSSVHVTAPIAPVRLGVVDVYSAFSATLLSARLPITSVDNSMTSEMASLTTFSALLPAASVATTVKV